MVFVYCKLFNKYTKTMIAYLVLILTCYGFFWQYLVTDLLWITATLFAVVYSSFEEGDAPKFQLISTPVSYNVIYSGNCMVTFYCMTTVVKM